MLEYVGGKASERGGPWGRFMCEAIESTKSLLFTCASIPTDILKEDFFALPNSFWKILRKQNEPSTPTKDKNDQQKGKTV